MKIQTSALISDITIDGKPLDWDQPRTVELEFSAIDAGGGFRDAILDFSFSFPKEPAVKVRKNGDECDIEATLQNPDERARKATFSYRAHPSVTPEDHIEVNGRLKGEQLSKEVVGFMLHLLR